MNRKQGSHNVYEYSKKFNYLAQYSAHHVDMDEQKAELFQKGLSAQLQDHLVLFRDQDGTIRACLELEEKKRKRAMSRPFVR
jgi:hypothetical protein